MTARDLASELEVSERTIYRDLTALSAAGVPVYAERGPGGGVRLVEEYRTTLTGLTPDETRALFMMSIPAPLAQLGLDDDFKAALLKLSASLPETRRIEESAHTPAYPARFVVVVPVGAGCPLPAHHPAGVVAGPPAAHHCPVGCFQHCI